MSSYPGGTSVAPDAWVSIRSSSQAEDLNIFCSVRTRNSSFTLCYEAAWAQTHPLLPIIAYSDSETKIDSDRRARCKEIDRQADRQTDTLYVCLSTDIQRQTDILRDGRVSSVVHQRSSTVHQTPCLVFFNKSISSPVILHQSDSQTSRLAKHLLPVTSHVI